MLDVLDIQPAKPLVMSTRERVAAFDVDPQHCFTPLCPEELPVPDGHTIVDALNAQARYARLRLGSKDAHPRGAIWEATPEAPALTPLASKHADRYWPRHAVPGTFGFSFLEGLPEPSQYDYFVWKGVEADMHPYGACFHDLENQLSTGVIEFLRAHQIQLVILGGLALEYCVKVTAEQLNEAGFKVVINLPATRALCPDAGRDALRELAQAGVVCVTDLAQVIAS